MNAKRKAAILLGFLRMQDLRQKIEKYLFTRANKRYI